MGHLFYTEFSGVAGGALGLGSDPDIALFSNFPTPSGLPNTFWSATEDLRYVSTAWYFDMNGGMQGSTDGIYPNYAWAVRSGDVVAAVPEAQSHVMLLAGLALVGWAARRRS